MEVMVEQFQTELLPVAAQLTARLVRLLHIPLVRFNNMWDEFSVNRTYVSAKKSLVKRRRVLSM